MLSELQAVVETLSAEKQQLETQLAATAEDTVSSTRVRAELGKTRQELQELAARLETAQTLEKEARETAQQEAATRAEAQDKYQHEVILHAADLEALKQARAQLDEATAQLAAAEDAGRAAAARLTEAEAGWKERQTLLDQQAEQQRQQHDELLQQNSLLHSQLEQLNGQLTAVQARLAPAEPDAAATGGSLNTSFSEADARTSEQLLEIIRYLRRQREIAETRAETAAAESARLRAQLQLAKQQLETSQSRLDQERQSSQASVESSARLAELLRKVETLNALTDSNRVLRVERDDLSRRCQELQVQLDTTRAEIEPLQVNLL